MKIFFWGGGGGVGKSEKAEMVSLNLMTLFQNDVKTLLEKDS